MPPKNHGSDTTGILAFCWNSTRKKNSFFQALEAPSTRSQVLAGRQHLQAPRRTATLRLADPGGGWRGEACTRLPARLGHVSARPCLNPKPTLNYHVRPGHTACIFAAPRQHWMKGWLFDERSCLVANAAKLKPKTPIFSNPYKASENTRQEMRSEGPYAFPASQKACCA